MTHHPRTHRGETLDRLGGFGVHAEPWAEGTVLALHGELDLHTVTDLEAALDAALAAPGSVIVIDCAGLEFCDSAGLDALLRARTAGAADDSRIELARSGPLLLRLLELAGAADASPSARPCPADRAPG